MKFKIGDKILFDDYSLTNTLDVIRFKGKIIGYDPDNFFGEYEIIYTNSKGIKIKTIATEYMLSLDVSEIRNQKINSIIDEV